MRAALAAAVGSAVLLFGAAACDTAEEVRSGVDEARSSAASVGAGAREACRASKDELTSLGDLAGRLADNPDLRVELAPEIRRTVDRLAREVGDRSELQPVVAAARDLAGAVGQANRDTVEAAARQTVVAVRGAEALCRVAG